MLKPSLNQLRHGTSAEDVQTTMMRAELAACIDRLVIGDSVVGTQGTPVEVLGRLVQTVVFPELWEVRNELTARSKAESA